MKMNQAKNKPETLSDAKAMELMEFLVTRVLANGGFRPVNLKITKIENIERRKHA